MNYWTPNDEFDFYFVWTDGPIDYDFKNTCFLQSAAGFYKMKNKEFDYEGDSLSLKAKKLMMDSGGFNILRYHKDYPWSINYYNIFCNEMKPFVAFCMDYIFFEEKKGQSGDSDEVKIDKRRRTIDNFIEQFDMERNYKLAIVIQGTTVHEHMQFIDELSDRVDLKKIEYFGIGGGGNSADLSWIENRSMLVRTLNKKLNKPLIHILGMNLRGLQNYIRVVGGVDFTSMDSWGWCRPIKNGLTYDDDMKLTFIHELGVTGFEAKTRCYKYTKYRISDILTNTDTDGVSEELF